MLVTIVREPRKGYWAGDRWVIRRAKRKLKDGKVMCHVGRKVLNRSFEYASDAIRHCVLKMNIPEYRMVFGDDVFQDIEKQKQKALDIALREQRIKQLADQFLPPSTSLDSLKLKLKDKQREKELLHYLSLIEKAETVYRTAVGKTLYWLEEDIKRFEKEN
jgi:hypothetical protein